MALNLAPKAAGATERYTWAIPLDYGDSVATASGTIASGSATIASQNVEDCELVLFLTGGTVGEVSTINVTAGTACGETIVDTLYLPVVATIHAFTTTARDVVSFALRKITGFGEDPDAAELADGLEWLNDMLGEWKAEGADAGAILPVAASDVLEISDAYIGAIKNNLIVRIADNYGHDISPVTMALARSGLQRIKIGRLSKDRAAAEYY